MYVHKETIVTVQLRNYRRDMRVVLIGLNRIGSKLAGDGDDESVSHGHSICRAITTNLDDQSDSQIVHWYNHRGETSENRIKELRSEFAGGNLPCGEFHANAAWLKLSSIAYNLFALMHKILPLR